jgi:hypothetical protein
VCSVDVKDLKTYQQVYVYVIPIITNLGFINIIVIAVRLRWFEKRFKAVGESPPSCWTWLCQAKPKIVLGSSVILQAEWEWPLTGHRSPGTGDNAGETQ